MKLIALASVGTMALMASGTATAQTAPASADDAAPGEIIVTASKRDERLLDVPVAITALSSDMVATLGIRDFRDYATLVPGLSQRDFGAPGRGTIILRGMNTGPQQVTNTAAFYIDDATYSSSGFVSVGALVTPSPDLVDIDRIEVLKGPQGTLYGASSLGGLVRIVTRKPDLDAIYGMAQVEGETLSRGGTGWSARGAINLPIVSDRVAIRASGFYRKAAGWIDNVGTGENNVNSSIIKGGRIAVRAVPTDRLTIDVNGFYQDIENNGTAAQDNVTGTTTPLYGRYKTRYATDSGEGRIRYRSVSGTASYDTDIGSIVGTASYVSTKASTMADYTQLYGTYLAQLGIVPAGTQVFATLGPNMKKTTAEVRIVSDRLGAFEFVVGGFYTHETSSYPNLLTATNEADVPLDAAKDIILRSNATGQYDEYAAFGNLTFYLTNHLDVTGGVRYAHNKQRAGTINGINFYAPTTAQSFSFTDDATTYLATIRYRPVENVNIFARAASGYRPGGPQVQVPRPATAQDFIRSDTVWNYEAGIKATALNGAFSGSLSAYRIDWTDIQLNTLFAGVVVQGNAGKARIDGFELELLARPTRELTVGVNAGHTDARITQIDASASGPLGAHAGDALPLTPKWTVATFADQSFNLSDTASASLGATLRFQSDMPGGYPGNAINPSIKIPQVTTLDLRAGLEFSRFALWLRAENVFNKLGYSTITTSALYAGQPVPTSAITIRPRALTLSATTNF